MCRIADDRSERRKQVQNDCIGVCTSTRHILKQSDIILGHGSFSRKNATDARTGMDIDRTNFRSVSLKISGQ
ncbi:hypothetical protein AA0242T_2607 [Acetobacter aceti NRIC 0242]|nr:hypothetical protein EDC15_10987 [Acetobacter aceti NBRC 14818]GAN56186.1 hypothetical protein Abac_003_085 [Acetobacter aceti NBRC 14818]GBO81905.1 hypothetical protein AA0242T_2607 [Acetobacter aceti NRIC 0242]